MNDIVSPQIIMFVDDDPENLKILEACFSPTHYLLRFFTSGERALSAARDEPPDVVLLDVRMPGMDGHEVCRRFKADERLRTIPILFLSALTSTEEITKGLDLGAVDYITKPFREAEALARVRNHLALSQAYARLAEQHSYLQELERQRDTYVHMLVHDMRSPLMAMLCHLQVIESCSSRKLSDDDVASLQVAIHSARMLSRMVSTVVDLSRMEHAQLILKCQTVLVASLFRSAREQVVDPSSFHRVKEEISEGCPAVYCDSEFSVRIVANLLANAIKYAPVDSNIVMGAEPDFRGQVRIWIKDHGSGIPLEDQKNIFEKFQIALNIRQTGVTSSGLGLAFCKLAAEAQGGTIGLESELGGGSLFWFTLPVASP
jgi:signal transduction histidine kinase